MNCVLEGSCVKGNILPPAAKFEMTEVCNFDLRLDARLSTMLTHPANVTH